MSRTACQAHTSRSHSVSTCSYLKNEFCFKISYAFYFRDSSAHSMLRIALRVDPWVPDFKENWNTFEVLFGFLEAFNVNRAENYISVSSDRDMTNLEMSSLN